jgi:penicillin-binding protein 1A
LSRDSWTSPRVIVCQDPEIQEIADSVVNDTSYWPEPVYQLNYALTLADKETKVQTNYSVENLESWFAEQQGYDYSARYYSEDEARAAADEFISLEIYSEICSVAQAVREIQMAL